MTHADQPDQGQEPELLRTADGLLLQTALNRVSRRAKIKAFLLVLPLLAFILVSFVAPIGQMLLRSVNNDQFVAKFNPHYFATPPDQLIYSHFPKLWCQTELRELNCSAKVAPLTHFKNF